MQKEGVLNQIGLGVVNQILLYLVLADFSHDVSVYIGSVEAENGGHTIHSCRVLSQAKVVA